MALGPGSAFQNFNYHRDSAVRCRSKLPLTLHSLWLHPSQKTKVDLTADQNLFCTMGLSSISNHKNLNVVLFCYNFH